MTRRYNFCAGPAALPEAVLAIARDDMLEWHDTGLSLMEMSHRSEEFTSVAETAEQDLRDLLSIPSDYRVLFLQGGASQQFAQIPLNFMPEGGSADYIDTGIWSAKAIEEASRYGHVNVAASAEARTTSRFLGRTTGSSRRPPAMCITRQTRPSADSSSAGYPKWVTSRLSLTCLRPFCPGRWMSRGSA